MSDGDWWYIDLALVICVAGVATFGLLAGAPGALRIALGAPLVLFLPGYALVSIFFPDAAPKDRAADDLGGGLRNPLSGGGGIDATERIGLSLVGSVIVVPSVALAATATPWGITARPVIVGLGLATIGLAVLGIVARFYCPANERFVPSVPAGILFSGDGRSAYDPDVTVFNVAIVCSLLFLLAAGGYALASPPTGEGFTEFSAETENVTGETETMYQDTYTQGEPQELTVEITNHEGQETTYTVLTLLQRVEYVNDTTVEVVEEEELARGETTIEDGVVAPRTIEFTPTLAGDDLRLVVLLFEGEVPQDPSAEETEYAIRLPIVVE
ncbi:MULTISPECIES: DUF1616 domain-containing protein [Saliphagus]|uniref:DUF1616 domain-containing protein n=1 Tax=Saliphagus infecundisoli TaxID=1849069 RepID=A0ABD5QMX5_9EURY|nr:MULTISPECIES: DUF1616 domain-containing protein [Saliphagus]